MKKIIFILLLLFDCILLQAHVSLIYPEGGETFNPGQQLTIEWEIIIPHNTENWDLYLSVDGGNTWEDLRLDIGADTLMYEWTVPEIASEQARIKVVMDNTGANYEDESDNFSITGSSGINLDEIIPGLNIYPNPARDNVFITMENQIAFQELDLVDLRGGVVRTFTMNLMERQLNIPLNGIKPGIYCLYIWSDQKHVVKKLVVTR